MILGSGDPSPDPTRQGPAVAVVVDDSVYLVDAGVGLVRRASEAAMERRISALAAPRLNKVFITHLHSDHTLGLADLMFTPWLMGRTGGLRAWGPAGLQAMGSHLAEAWSEDLAMRAAWEKSENPDGYQLVGCEIPRDADSRVVYTDDLVTVTAFAVSHGDWNQELNPPVDTAGNRAFGYRFDTPDASVVISGDTKPDPETFRRFCNGCDILLHEVYSIRERAVLTDSARRVYDRQFHTPSLALAEAVAPAARPRLLVLYHASHFPGVTNEELLQEVAEHYPGRVCFGHDLDVFSRGGASQCEPADADAGMAASQ
ncbi:MAG TPA: MBL fold metallo-hydrolase [Longimicrobium sp.]